MADQQSFVPIYPTTVVDGSATTTTSSQATLSSANAKVSKRSRGRPRKQAPTNENLEVSIEGKEIALKSTRNDLIQGTVLLSLCVPNRLLFEWQQQATQPRDYITLLNKKVVDKAVALRFDCDRIAVNLARRAGVLRSQVVAASGRARENLLAKSIAIPVCQGEAVAPQPLMEEIENLHVELATATMQMQDREEEVTTLKQKMAQLLQEREAVVNKGKTVEKVSERQRRRKLSHFRSVSEAGLWFAETFGLVLDRLTTHTIESGETVFINFSTTSESQVPHPPETSRIVDDFCAMQTLYLLDRFGVSDEFYHELTQVCMGQ